MPALSDRATSAEDRTRLVTTDDGGRLGVSEWGSGHGAPVFFLHGTPGSRFLRHPGSVYADLHLRVVTYDRPGYGLSTRRPAHAVADAAGEVARIADELGIERFAVVGVSGGGPRSLAVAALLPDRVTRCATIVGVAPLAEDGFDADAGMDDESRSEWRAARDGGAEMDRHCAEVLRWVEDGLPGLDLDAEPWGPVLRETFTEAVRQGVDGYRDDREALVADWGFSVADVAAPTRLMFAVDDASVPRSHWDWLATHVPGSVVVPVPGGHASPRDEAEAELFAWLGQES